EVVQERPQGVLINRRGQHGKEDAGWLTPRVGGGPRTLRIDPPGAQGWRREEHDEDRAGTDLMLDGRHQLAQVEIALVVPDICSGTAQCSGQLMTEVVVLMGMADIDACRAHPSRLLIGTCCHTAPMAGWTRPLGPQQAAPLWDLAISPSDDTPFVQMCG